MSTFKPHLYQLSAYTPPLEGRDPNSHLLLDFNERTLPLGKPVRDALVEYIESGRLQMYPSYGDIVSVLAEYVGVAREQLMITNGSDQGIELIFRASCQAGDEVIIPAPNFAMYQQCASVENVVVKSPFYVKGEGFPVAEVVAAVSSKTRVICISNPNNPSGVGVSVEEVATIAAAAPEATILVDECYFEYSKITAVPLLERYPNIVITRTFSKTWGMPSLRFGYIVASAENVAALLCVRGPYDINQLAVVAAKAALENPEYTERYVDEVMSKSKPALEAFLAARDIPFWPSCANYLWVFPDRPDELASVLAGEGILVRPKADSSGRVGLRVTLGSYQQTERLIEVLASALGV